MWSASQQLEVMRNFRINKAAIFKSTYPVKLSGVVRENGPTLK